VITSAFACEFASSDTWRLFELRDSCYSWWLPPPRQLGVAKELWQELVIVLGHLPVICEGFLCLPRRSVKGNSSGLRVSFKLPHLWVGSCDVHGLDEVRATPLSRQTTSVGQHNGDVACRQARESRKKNTCVSCHLVFSWSIDWLLSWWLGHPLRGGITIFTSHLLSRKVEYLALLCRLLV
jgi:hypothetical protein